MELWTRIFKIKGGHRWLSGSLPGGYLITLQLPAFPKGQYFGWEGTLGAAQDQAGLAEGGRVIPLRVF